MAMVLPILLAAIVAPSACPNVRPPVVEISMAVEKPVIRHDLTKAEMANFKGDTSVPNQMQDVQHVERGGMMHGDIHVNYNVQSSAVPGNTVETVNLNCVKYDRIQITLDLAPTIFIAKEFDKQSCWYDQILQHEQSHIDMDRVVIEKYKDRLKAGMDMAFEQPQDAVQGPVAAKGVPALKKSMGEQLMNMTTMMISDMSRERAEMQQGVDSLKGYAFIMNSCYEGDNVIKVKP